MLVGVDALDQALADVHAELGLLHLLWHATAQADALAGHDSGMSLADLQRHSFPLNAACISRMT